MSLPNCPQEVCLLHGKKVDQIKNLGQKDWMSICKKLGLFVSPANGKGSHCGVYKNNICSPSNTDCCVVVLPSKIYPQTQRNILKRLVFYGLVSGLYTEEIVWEIIGV